MYCCYMRLLRSKKWGISQITLNAMLILWVVFFTIACDTQQSGILVDERPGNINHHQALEPIDVTFNKLVDAVEAVSGTSLCLNPPATDDEISFVENLVGQQFPEELKQIYRMANGQQEAEACVPLFYQGYVFLPLASVVDQWEVMKQLHDESPSFGDLYHIQGAVNGYHWSPNWIPIAYFISGDLLCIDYTPTEKGVVGQVVEFIHDDFSRDHLGGSINAYMSDIYTKLMSGEFAYHTQWGVITDKDQINVR